MENLISMTDFVLEQEITIEVQSLTDQWELRSTKFHRIQAYAKFLKQPLELWMFVPCGKDGQPLKIIPFKEHQQGSNYEFMQHELYRQAKERCLFEGFEYIKDDYKSIFSRIRWEGNREILIQYFKEMNIENLIRHDLKLTESAKKMFI